jgi:hypothetical protein
MDSGLAGLTPGPGMTAWDYAATRCIAAPA